MRRLVVLFVLGLVGAGLFGLSGASSGLVVDNTAVSSTAFFGELSAISHHNTLQCYITALDPTNFAPGSGGYTIRSTGAAAWANLRVEGLAIDHYVTTTLHYRPDARALASARASLEGEMTQQAALNSLHCPGTSAQALAEMPAEMRAAQIEDQATSLYLVARLKKTIPLTTSAMRAYFARHASSYDTLCVSVALVLPSSVSAFAHAQAAGENVATLAKQFSQDPSGQKGGAYGCYGPTSRSYSGVRADAGTLALDTFPTTPQYINNAGTVYGLYVAVTSRTPTTFAQAAPAVLSDLRNLNASSATTVKNSLLYAAAVHVDPAFGRWGLNTTGPQVFAPSAPAPSQVPDPKALVTPSSATYK